MRLLLALGLMAAAMICGAASYLTDKPCGPERAQRKSAVLAVAALFLTFGAMFAIGGGE